MSHGPQWHAGPPWSSDHGRPWAHQSHAVRPLRSTGARCDKGKRKRGVEESSARLKSAGSTLGWGRRWQGASGGGGDRWWAALEHGEVEKKVARGAVRLSGARGTFYRPARRTEGVGAVRSSTAVEIQWSRLFHGVKRGGESTGCRVREVEGKAAGWRFASATHARGRMADGCIRCGNRLNGRWWRGIGREEKVPRVGSTAEFQISFKVLSLKPKVLNWIWTGFKLV
jgi:hypothetical protein